MFKEKKDDLKIFVKKLKIIKYKVKNWGNVL